MTNSMCCARTAALQGRNENQQVKTSMSFLQQSMRHVYKNVWAQARQDRGKGNEHAERTEHQTRVAAIPDSTMLKNV